MDLQQLTMTHRADIFSNKNLNGNQEIRQEISVKKISFNG
jgi:hypothetical protein